MSNLASRNAKKHFKTLPESRKFDILIYSDFNCTTGFGNVMKKLIDDWKEKIAGKKQIQIVIFALNDQSQDVYKYSNNITVIPANVAPFCDPKDAYQRAAFLSLVQNNSFNLIYLLNDMEVVGTFSKDLQIINLAKKKKKTLQFKTLFYFPIDSEPRKRDLSFLENFDEIVTYTQYAKDFISNNGPQKVADRIQVIPHGVDLKTFKKLPVKTTVSFKEKLFGANKIVIGNVNRNSARKDISTLVIAFHKLKSDLANVGYISDRLCLYLHCNPVDPAGVNLKMLCSRLDLEIDKDVFFPKNYSENKGVSETELNKIYNSIDVFVTTSTAEGWGLTVTEAIAAETLSIVPAHTSLKELIQPDGKYYNECIVIPEEKLEKSVFVYDGDKIRFKTPVDDLVGKLHYAVNLTEQGTPQKEYFQGLRNTLKKYDWEQSANAFWDLIIKYYK